jgi:hypothetical protein
MVKNWKESALALIVVLEIFILLMAYIISIKTFLVALVGVFILEYIFLYDKSSSNLEEK